MCLIRLPVCGIELNLLNGPGAGTVQSHLHHPNDSPELTAALGAIESLALAHASARVDVQSPAYLEGLETAVDACFQAYS